MLNARDTNPVLPVFEPTSHVLLFHVLLFVKMTVETWAHLSEMMVALTMMMGTHLAAVTRVATTMEGVNPHGHACQSPTTDVLGIPIRTGPSSSLERRDQGNSKLSSTLLKWDAKMCARREKLSGWRSQTARRVSASFQKARVTGATLKKHVKGVQMAVR